MKKVFFMVSAALLSAAVVSAQSTGIHFGVRAGVNLANIVKDGDENYATEMKPGLAAGAFVEIPLGKVISVQPELMFSQKGYKSTGTFLLTNYDYRVTTNFIEVPLLAKFNASKAFAVLVGPQFSFLSSTDYKFKAGSTQYQDLVKNENDNVRKNTVGGVLGLEFALSKNAVLGARYALDLRSNRGDGTYSTPTYKNQVFNFNIGIRL